MGIRVGGLATGIDSASLIEGLIAFERRPLELVQQRKTELETQRSLFRELNTRLLALRDAAADLDNRNAGLSAASFDEELLVHAASSADETIVQASAGGNAAPGSYDVHVEQLATVGRRISTTFADDTAIIANAGDTLTVDYGGSSPIALTVGAGGASLQDLRDGINSDPNNGGNVHADVLFDGTAYRLVVSGTQTGAANDLTLTTTVAGQAGAPFEDAALAQTAQDARIQVLGVTIDRPGNAISDALPGLTLTLRGAHANPTDTTRVDVTRDDAAVQEKVQAFVDAYNSVVNFLEAQSRFDETQGAGGPLSGDPTLRSIQSKVRGALVQQYGFPGNPFTSLGELGVNLDREGRLSLDAAALTAALDQNPLAVRQVLGGDDTADGVLTALSKALDPITEPATGTLALRDDTFDQRLDSLDRQIERFEQRLEKREELLVRQFAQLEAVVAGLQSQSNSLQGLITSLNRERA